MDAEQKKEIEDAIFALIKEDYHRDFESVYEVAVTILKDFVPLACEEIRNANNHVARALSVDDVDDARLNLARARRHIHYAKYVCLVLCVLQELNAADVFINTLEQQVGRNTELRERMADIRAERDQIKTIVHVVRTTVALVDADTQETKDVNVRLERLLTKISDLQEELRDNYSVVGIAFLALRTKFWRVLHWIWDNLFLVIAIGILVHLIGSATYAVLLEEFVKQKWIAPPHTVSPTAPPAPAPESNQTEPSPSTQTQREPTQSPPTAPAPPPQPSPTGPASAQPNSDPSAVQSAPAAPPVPQDPK
jgi:hypothetical protein